MTVKNMVDYDCWPEGLSIKNNIKKSITLGKKQVTYLLVLGKKNLEWEIDRQEGVRRYIVKPRRNLQKPGRAWGSPYR
jgi:hypothetical protein